MAGLENKIVRLRALEPSDVEILYNWENDTSVWQISGTLSPFSKKILARYIETSNMDIYETKQLRFMIDSRLENYRTIGAIDLFDFDPFHLRAGIGILIAEEKDRSKGYATAALDILIHYCFNILGLHQIFCNVETANKKSLMLFKKFGFEVIGEKKDWLKTADGWTNELMLQLLNKR
ncbi:MAG: GNAT family protein [Bacteroidota bacterium]|nr:GNAT family protein [Bacteroidota bacterium]